MQVLRKDFNIVRRFDYEEITEDYTKYSYSIYSDQTNVVYLRYVRTPLDDWNIECCNYILQGSRNPIGKGLLEQIEEHYNTPSKPLTEEDYYRFLSYKERREPMYFVGKEGMKMWNEAIEKLIKENKKNHE